MVQLQDTYPLYLNNKAAQPNTDLAVTDKFTGEVAFRTALATTDVIDQAIAGAVRAAEPMLVWHLLQPKRLGHQPSVGSQPQVLSGPRHHGRLVG